MKRFVTGAFRRHWYLAALTTALVVVERTLLLYAVVRGPNAWIPLGVALSAVYFVRLGVRAVLRARLEAMLYEATVEAALRDAALSIPVRGLENTLFVGVEDVTNATSVFPDIVGEAIGIVIVGTYLATAMPLRTNALLAVGVVALIGCGAAIKGAASRASKKYWDRYQDVSGGLQDVVHGRVDLVACNAGAPHRERLRAAVGELHVAARGRWIFDTMMGRGATVVVVGVIFVATAMFGAERFGLAQAMIIGSALPCLAGLSWCATQVVRARSAFVAVGDLLATPMRAPRRESLDVHEPMIALEQVSLELEGRSILKSISARLEPRTITAVIGHNGAGKSSLLKTIVGLSTPTRGDVLLDGRLLQTISLDAWRAHVAYLSQTPYLSNSSVFAAMRLVAPDAPAPRLREALELVGLWSLLAHKCPDDPLKAAVEELSAGEKQRVGIARAIARRSAVYLLDEPETNLDHTGIEMLLETLCTLSSHATVIVAAHTPEIVAIADRVIELEAGVIVRDERRPISGRQRVDRPA